MKERLREGLKEVLIFALGAMFAWGLLWGGSLRWQMAYAQLQERYNNVIEQANERIQELQAQVSSSPLGPAQGLEPGEEDDDLEQ